MTEGAALPLNDDRPQVVSQSVPWPLYEADVPATQRWHDLTCSLSHILSQELAHLGLPSGGLQVKVQLVSSRCLTVWTGCLPLTTTPDHLLKAWQRCAHHHGLWPGARVLSGPWPLDSSLPLQQLGTRLFRNSKDEVLLQVCQHTFGGCLLYTSDAADEHRDVGWWGGGGGG